MPPKETDTLTGGSAEAGSESSPAGAQPTGSEEVVPKARFDGLMGTMNAEKARADAAEKAANEAKAEAERLRAIVTPPAPVVTDEISPAILKLIEEAKGQSSTVYETLKATSIATLIERYPNASKGAVTGTTPEQWEASLRADHERVQTILDSRMETLRDEADKKAREEYGVPMGVGAGGGPLPARTADEYDAAFEKAVKAKDSATVAKLLLLGKPTP